MKTNHTCPNLQTNNSKKDSSAREEGVRFPTIHSRITLTRYCAPVILLSLVALSSLIPSQALSSSSAPRNAPSAGHNNAIPNKRMFVSSIKVAGKARLETDKKDYAPGEKVTLTGVGWKPRETVKLRVRRSNKSPDELFTARADRAGQFKNRALTIRKSDLGVTFVLTATGASSNYRAEITFSDGNVTIKPAYQGQMNAGGLQTFTLTKRIFTGSTDCSTCAGDPITVTGVDASTGHTFALGTGDSALLSAPAFSEQNGGFGGAWFSPTMSPFTADFTGRNICVSGPASAATYIAPFKPGIVTLDSTCTTPKTLFNLGETICVRVFGDPSLTCGQPTPFFAISLTDPDSAVRNCTPDCITDTSSHVTADQGTYSFTLPATDTTMATDNRGPWLARVLDCNGNAQGQTTFLLHNPSAGHEAVDLRVEKGQTSAPVPPNGTIQYEVRLANVGPDPAQNVVLTDAVPGNTTFVSFDQLSGPTFMCTLPSAGGTGTVSCTAATLPVSSGVSNDPQNAVFRMVVKVNNVAGDGSVAITNTANASSDGTETHPSSNMSMIQTTVQSAACSLTCPADISATANAMCASPPFNCGPGTVVNFPTNPTATGTCGAVGCSPPSGSCFPVGTTSVSCFENNAGCTFLVKVAAQTCMLSCPANITQNNDPGQCSATVTFATPGGAGCGTVSCNPASGTMFPVGMTTVTCTPTTGSPCTFTVTVTDAEAPAITCPASVSAVTPTNVCSGPGCSIVNYSTPVATDNCPGVTTACVPPAGSCFPLGSSSVTCTATDVAGNQTSCSFTVTVFDVCLQDDSVPSKVLLFNSKTGEYKLCCGGAPVSGTGTVVIKGCLITLTHNPTDRRLSASIDKTMFKGTATLQSPPGVLKCSITDRDTRNNSCICP